MIPARSPDAELYRHSVIGRTPESLTDIYREDVNIAVWQRQAPHLALRDAQELAKNRSFNGLRCSIPTQKLSRVADSLSEISPYPYLQADVQLLIEMFSCLFELKAVGLRLTPLKNAMCPKFHVDRVPCRLITTYRGPATQWLPHHCVDRSKLGTGSAGLSDQDSGLYPSEAHIETLTAGDVALLKGELWEGNEGAGAVHRSPAVESGHTRLLLTLDFS